MSRVSAIFNLEAKHPALPIAKVLHTGEENICLLVRVLGVAPADPAPGPELVLRMVPVTGSLSGLAGTEAWRHGVGGGLLWRWSNSQASEGIRSLLGENPQLSLEPTPPCSGLHRVLALVSRPCCCF